VIGDDPVVPVLAGLAEEIAAPLGEVSVIGIEQRSFLRNDGL
jgi:hypothetical protein